MRFCLLCALMLVCGGFVVADQGAVPEPKKPAPQFCFVRKIDDDSVTFVSIRFDDSDQETVARIKDMSVHDTQGRTLTPEAWRRKLTKGAVVVLAAGNQPVDPAYTKLLKDDTLLITIKEPPYLAMYGPRRGIGDDEGKWILHWRGTGASLQAQSVSLSYAEKPTGPWRLIQDKLATRGEYAWKPPARLPVVIYLQVEATEKDGSPLKAKAELPVPSWLRRNQTK